MKITELLIFVWELVKYSVLRTILIILTIIFLPSISIFTIMLSTLVWIYLFDLWKGAPTPKSWVKKFLYTFSVFLVLAVAYYLFGFLGLFGAAAGTIIILLSFASFAIWQNWKVFDAVTSWGAERVKGKHKKSFDIKKVIK